MTEGHSMEQEPSEVLLAEVLGRPVRFESNDPRIIGHAREIVHESGREISMTLDTPLRIRVIADATRGGSDDRVQHLSDGSGMLRLASTNVSGVVDGPGNLSSAIVPPSFVDDGVRFRDEVLDPLTFALLANHDRHPVHASSVLLGDCAIMFAGPSGAGKSTLARIASSLGAAPLSDDLVWVQLAPSLRVWGGAAKVRELDAEGVKRTRRLDVDSTTRSIVARRAVVCLLTRGDAARAEPVESTVVEHALQLNVAPGFDRFPQRLPRVARALARPGGWILTLTRDLHDAPSLITEVFASIRA